MDQTILVKLYRNNVLIDSIEGGKDGFFPFGRVFRYLTDDGRFKHLMTEDHLVATLAFYKLPLSLIAFSRTANKFIYNEIIRLNDNMIPRFQRFMQFLFSILYPNDQDLFEFTYFRRNSMYCVIM